MAVIGIGLLIIGQAVWLNWRDQPLYGLPFVVAGCVALLLVRDPANVVASEPTSVDNEYAKLRPWRASLPFLIVGVGLIAFVGWRGTLQPSGNVWVLIGLWALGIAVVFYALVPGHVMADWIGRVRRSIRVDRREWLLVLILFAIALFLRLIDLGNTPPLFAEDEGYFSLQAANIAAESHWEQNPFTLDPLRHIDPMLFNTLQAISIQIWGRTVAAARMLSALIGALTIPGLYLAARRMFDRRVAVIAAIFLVTFAQHLHFSRIAINFIMDATSAIWLFAFLTAALRTHDPMEYALAGVILGLSQYGYASSRLIPILCLIYVGLFVLARQIFVKKESSRLLAMALVTAVVIWPEIYALASQHIALFPRLGDTATFEIGSATVPQMRADVPVTSVDFWIHQVVQSFLGFVQAPDSNIFYGIFDPILGWIAPIFFLIGLTLAIRHRKKPNWSIPIIWLALTAILGGVLLIDPPQYQRFLIATPALAVLVAVGLIYAAETLAWLSDTLTPTQPVSHRIKQWGIPAAAVVVLAGFNLKTYAIDYRFQHGYFLDYRTFILNQFADKMLPSLVGYKIWYFSNYDLNLWSSPVLTYKVPGAVGQEYDVPGGFDQLGPAWVPHLENLLHDLNAYKGKEAVVIAAHYPKLDEVVRQVSQIPGVTRLKVAGPILDAAVIVYYWDSESAFGEGQNRGF